MSRLCRVGHAGGGSSIWLINDNKIYTDEIVPREWFNEHVLAKVVALIKVQDHCLPEGQPYPTIERVRGL